MSFRLCSLLLRNAETDVSPAQPVNTEIHISHVVWLSSDKRDWSIQKPFNGLDDLLGTVIMLWAEKSGVPFPAQAKPSYRLWGPQSLLLNYNLYFFSLKNKQPGHEAHHRTPGDEITYEQTYISDPPVCHHDVDKHNFTF
jgi:hypothetical protein